MEKAGGATGEGRAWGARRSMVKRYYAEVETISRDELKALQFRRLKSRVDTLYEGSLFYREKWDQAGVHPDDLKSLDDFARFPLVTKTELRDEQAAYPPFGRITVAPRGTWREVHPSSGTTGRQVQTVWTELDVEAITDFTARFMWAFGVRPDHIVQNAFSYGLWVAGMAVHYASRRLGCLNIPIGGQPAPHQLRLLRDIGANVITATPSFGVFLAETLQREGIDPLDIGLEIGAFGGEAGVEVGGTRQRLEAGLGIRAYDFYGLAEIGPTMGAECEAQSGLHWAEDQFLVEIVDPATGRAVQEGELGLLVITHLTREGSPMVRYATNDIARYTSDRCACGRTHGRSPGGILGRQDDLVIYRGSKFYPTQVEEVVRAIPGFTGEYVVEVSTGANELFEVTVVAEADPGVPDPQTTLRAKLKETLLVSPQVRIVEPGALGRTEFKAKRIIRAS